MSDSQTTKKTFGQRLRNLREIAGLTQQELANRSGIHYTAIAHFEAGRRKPDLTNLIILINTLNVSADLLLGTKRS